jgi:hypothetical protein
MISNTLPSDAIQESLELSSKTLEQILEIYLPEHRYICSANLCDTSLTCSIKPTSYPYTQEQVFNYITAPTATLFACQLAYVLIGGMVIISHPLTTAIKSLNIFRNVRDSALLRFAKIDLRFRSEVENKWPIHALINIDKAKRYHNSVHCSMDFCIGNGISGNIHGVLIGEG